MDIDTDHNVLISKERLDELLDNEKLLLHLMAHGVDNWQGYDDAFLDYEEDES